MKKSQKPAQEEKKVIMANYAEPKFVEASYAGSGPNNTNTRRNRAATIQPTDRYINIEGGLNPYFASIASGGLVDIQYAVELSQMAWYNVGIIRNAIEVMVELCDSSIYIKGGNSTSRNFIGKWLKRIQLSTLKEEFFREYFRSGNVFLYRFDAKFDANSARTLSEIYGFEEAEGAQRLERLPIRYVLLNPARIRTNNTVIFQNSQYFQMLPPIEMSKLRYPKTQEDEDLFKNLDPETRKKILNNIIPYIPLDQALLYPIFSKKQDYEPFAVPFVFPVLEQVNAHIELQKVDMALARTLDRAILLITNGTDPDKGGVNPQTISTLQSLLKSESVTRTLVADYTTKGEWLIPDLSKLLGPEKYTELNNQINIGLNSLFFDSNEKFASASIKAKIFLERLEAPRKKFLTFLQNEVQRICDIMNFKSYPEVYFEDITLRDEAEFTRLYTRMAELGLLTPQQFFDAIDNGNLPDTSRDDFLTQQEEYQKQRQKGLWLPQVGASMQDPNGQAAQAAGQPGSQAPKKPAPMSPGRPTGTKSPQTVSKKIKPIGASLSLKNITQNTIAAEALVEKIEGELKKKHKLKELDVNQKDVAKMIAQALMINEERDTWNSRAKDYLKEYKSPSEEKVNEIEALASEHGVDLYQGTILYLSRV